MKSGWDEKTLIEVCEIKPPKSEAKAKLNKKDQVSFLPMEDLGVEQKYLRATRSRELKDVAGSYTYFADGDVLLAKITPCFENGKLGIASNLVNGVGFGSSEYFVFRPTKGIDKEYLYYFLSQEKFRDDGARSMTGAVGHKRVSKDFIEKSIIPLPSVPEQRRIVSTLDKAFAAIATAKENAERNLKNAEDLFLALLDKTYSETSGEWKTKMLSEITTKIGSGATPTGGEQAYQEKGIPLIRSLNVHDLGFRKKDLAFLNKNQADGLANVVVESGDVLLNITGASIARCCIAPEAFLPARVNQHVSIIRLVKSEMVPEFLHFALISRMFKDKLLGIGEKNGATRQALTKALLEELQISFPSVLTQKIIVGKAKDFLGKTQELKRVFETKVLEFDDLKKSILQKAFKGELSGAAA